VLRPDHSPIDVRRGSLAPIVVNALLLVLIGLEAPVISFSFSFLVAGALATPATLLARFTVVATPMAVLRRLRERTPHTRPSS
jgi:CPA1 family monovalent cation:H+ antiporter